MNRPQSQRPEGFDAKRLYLTEATPEDDEDTLDIRGILLTVWHGKWIIVVCTIIAAFLGDLQQLAADRGIDSRQIQDQMQILQSTVLIERVIDQLNLDQNPEFNPFIRVAEPALIDRLTENVSLPPELEDLATNMGILRPPPPEPDAEDVRLTGRLAIIRNVSNRLSLEQVDFSRVINISFTSINPGTAERVANAIAEQYIADQVAAKIETARAAC